MPAPRLAVAVVAGLFVAASLPSCSKNIRETAATVLTLQGGTMTELRAMRGNGPFRTYAIPPPEMISIVGAVLRTKVVAVFEVACRGEVVGKERDSKLATEDTYSEAFRSAVIVFVHPVPGDENSSKLEIHAMQRGPFHTGSIGWEAELPPLLDDAVAHRGTTPIRPLK